MCYLDIWTTDKGRDCSELSWFLYFWPHSLDVDVFLSALSLLPVFLWPLTSQGLSFWELRPTGFFSVFCKTHSVSSFSHLTTLMSLKCDFSVIWANNSALSQVLLMKILIFFTCMSSFFVLEDVLHPDDRSVDCDHPELLLNSKTPVSMRVGCLLQLK